MFIFDPIGDMEPVFLSFQQSFVAHFPEELRELGLRDTAIFFEFAYGFISEGEFTEDEKSFRVGKEFEDIRHLFGLSFQIERSIHRIYYESVILIVYYGNVI